MRCTQHSKGWLSNNVTRRIIITNDKSVTAHAKHSCTSNPQTLLPHKLCVMQAVTIRLTSVSPPVIEFPLRSPRNHRVLWGPPFSTSPKEILPIRSTGVDKVAVSTAGSCPPGGIAGETVAPFERREIKLGS